MQIVTDSGTDVSLITDNLEDLNIHIVPLIVTLDGASYREGIDIEPEAFYAKLEASSSLPTTSQPSAGDFAEVYRELAVTDPDILSIHISSGLSGTFQSSIAGAQLVPEANVTHVDTKTLSGGAGWQVVAAARAVRAGWSLEEALTRVELVRQVTESHYTLKELKYLIHGGRISHMKGLIASVLKLKPLIGVEKVNGTYIRLGQARAFDRALKGLVDLVLERYPEGSALQVQVVHALNPEGADRLRELVDEKFDCTWIRGGPMSLVLGAHTGPSMVGMAYGPQGVFDDAL